jgi:alcohol dehydrogenase class IV
MYKIYCRVYQSILRATSYFLPWREPELIEGENSLNKLPEVVKNRGIDRVLIITDKGITSLGLMDGMLNGLRVREVDYLIYDKTVPNPTIDNIEEALQLYKENGCQGLIAFGGGSSIDCAKGVGARVARPNKSIPEMKGLFKVRKKLPPLFAVPTTSGTGSEATVTAVITNSQTHEKFLINDLSLIPHYAVLDPLLTVKLPAHLTSTTGMDALTHAVEAFIGRSNTRETKEYAKRAVELIFENLYEAYSNGENIIARARVQKASYLAGLAFTRAYVGYVHAMAHALGGLYSIPHGLANAIILPYVLEYYGEVVYRALAELADLVHIANPNDTEEKKARKFIEAVKGLNKKMNIPERVKGIKEEDIPLMVDRALKEANPFYPVPKIFSRKEMANLYHLIKE